MTGHETADQLQPHLPGRSSGPTAEHPPGPAVPAAPAEPVIRAARPDEASRLVRLVTAAFLPLPPTQWLLPPDTEPHRKQIFAGYFAIFLHHGFTTGAVTVVCTADDHPVSVALWWDGDAPAPDDYHRKLLDAVGQSRVHRFEALDDRMAAAHPKIPSHTYLAFIATWPGWQGLGWGSALLRHHHAELDRANLPGYLEAGSEPARDLYLRLGYQTCGEPIRLPEGGPVMWPMWRPVQRPPTEPPRVPR